MQQRCSSVAHPAPGSLSPKASTSQAANAAIPPFPPSPPPLKHCPLDAAGSGGPSGLARAADYGAWEQLETGSADSPRTWQPLMSPALLLSRPAGRKSSTPSTATKRPFHASLQTVRHHFLYFPRLDDDIAENIHRWACMMGCASRKADASLSSLKTLHLLHASKHCSQNGDGGFGDLEPGLSRAGGGVTLPLHPPLSTTRAGNQRGSHQFPPFLSLWSQEYA